MLSTAIVLGSTPIVHGDSVSVSHARELLPFLRQKKEVNRRKDKQVVNLGAYLGRVKSRDDRCTAVYPVTKDLSKLGRSSTRVLRGALRVSSRRRYKFPYGYYRRRC